ncbi:MULTISPECIES: chlorinating enzyme [Dactylosporangium]|uniref:Chemotaxis protein CheX n=2 Tax=Dactylosporangium TaxID=35753 RepID=A0A9W6KNJ4_9ACTN|nr:MULTISPECIES: chlorinating enzyme [Dactylosporangium]UAB93881.1 chlorinating enzyme [Dactylosporangium vinaceum]UWZ42301.1 chlorinating enzyme [Dactylosporangium matsuzakiense]GLL05326.1 chemotaxis protein CheX [Dactylosporangium matsuzakiense]
MTQDIGTRQFALTPEELDQFQKNGFYGPFKVYEVDEMRQIWRRERLALMDRSNAIYQEEAAQSGNTNISNYDRHMDSDFLADHICRPEIVEKVSSVLGPDVLCWRTEFFPKYPGDEGTDWHQADTFANASGSPQIVWAGDEHVHFGGTLTVWAAFTEANLDTGCLQFMPGTHQSMMYDETKKMHYDPNRINREAKNGVQRGFFGYDYRELQIDEDFEPDESLAVPMVMRPGEAIMFWSTLMHASLPHNGTTDEMRLGFATRYVPTSVHVYPDTEEIVEYGGKVSLDRFGSVVVSGVNEYPYNRIATQTTTGHPFTTR